MKQKRKAIHAELMKESVAHSVKLEGWLKYEVTIEEKDGSTSRIPAYGKDLQDALSRVVHDEKVKTIEERVINKVPETGWAFAWFLGMCLLVILGYNVVPYNYTGYLVIGIVLTYGLMTLSISNWFRLRNRKK